MTDPKPPSRTAPQFIVRFSDGMRESIAEAARANNRSINAEILDRLQAADRLNLENSALKGRVAALEELAREKSKRLLHAEGRGAACNEHLARVQAKLEESGRRLAEVSSRAEELAVRRRQAEERLEEQRAMNSALAGEYRKFVEEKATAVASLERELRSAQEARSAADSRTRELQEQLRRYLDEETTVGVKALRGRLADMQRELDRQRSLAEERKGRAELLGMMAHSMASAAKSLFKLTPPEIRVAHPEMGIWEAMADVTLRGDGAALAQEIDRMGGGFISAVERFEWLPDGKLALYGNASVIERTLREWDFEHWEPIGGGVAVGSTEAQRVADALHLPAQKDGAGALSTLHRRQRSIAEEEREGFEPSVQEVRRQSAQENAEELRKQLAYGHEHDQAHNADHAPRQLTPMEEDDPLEAPGEKSMMEELGESAAKKAAAPPAAPKRRMITAKKKGGR